MIQLVHLNRVVGALLFLCLLAPLPAQKATKSLDAVWRRDPFTKNEASALKAAGYVSYAPFAWAAGKDTTDVEALLGSTVRVLWVETRHFKIGTSLPTWKVPGDRKTRKKIRRELTRLKARLPSVNPRSKKLTPWLRLHLTAQRLEELYADFEKRLGVTDKDFVAGKTGPEFMGNGPYLGVPSKFLVLLMTRKDPYSRYIQSLRGKSYDYPMRHYLIANQQFFFGTAVETNTKTLVHDTAMHCHVVWNVTQNLVSAFKSYSFDAPLWLREGLAHWYSRNIDEKWTNIGQDKEDEADKKKYTSWAPKVRARLKWDYYKPAREVMRWTKYGNLKFADHMMIWSRVDFLMNRDKTSFGKFMALIKARFHPNDRAPTTDEIFAQQDLALQQALGLDADGFDREWKQYVMDRYPKK